MKKVVLVGAIVLLSLASCVKEAKVEEYSCDCTLLYNDGTDFKMNYALYSESSDDAGKKCAGKAESLLNSFRDLGGVGCEWKLFKK